MMGVKTSPELGHFDIYQNFQNIQEKKKNENLKYLKNKADWKFQQGMPVRRLP